MSKNNFGLQKFLEENGVLENGTDEEIKIAKRNYRKIYLQEYKQKQRSENQEFPVLLSREKGEHGKISLGAKQHKMSVSAFLRLATLAYLNKTFLVPNRDFVAKLAQLLSDCLNEVREISSVREKYSFEREQKYEAIEKRIEKLEIKINEIFLNPFSLEDSLRSAIQKDPALKERLLILLSHDSKNQNI